MNIKKIGLLTLSLSLLAGIGISGAKNAHVVNAAEPEPLILDLHQEKILNKFAEYFNESKTDWEKAITDWVYNDDEDKGISFFNQAIDDFEFFPVNDIKEVKDFVYIEYLFLVYHLDIVDLPNKELDSVYHEYASGTDYIRGMLDHLIVLTYDMSALFQFDYSSPLDDNNPDDVENVTSLIKTAYNVYNTLNESYFEFYNFSDEDFDSFLTSTTTKVKNHFKTMSNTFVTNPDLREDTTFNFGQLANRILKLLRYVKYDYSDDCEEIITPVPAEEIFNGHDSYLLVKEEYESEHGSWFATTIDPEVLGDFFFKIEEYNNAKGLFIVYYFLDFLSNLENNSNENSGFASFFLNNSGPILYKLMDLFEAIRIYDVPNVAIIGKELLLDLNNFAVLFYDNCLINMTDSIDLANKIYRIQSDLGTLEFELAVEEITVKEAIEVVIELNESNKVIALELDQYTDSVEKIQMSESFNYYLKHFNEFKNSFTEDMVDSLTNDFYSFLTSIRSEAIEILATDIVNPDDLLEFRTKVYELKQDYNEYLDELADKVNDLGLSEDYFTVPLTLGEMLIIDFNNNALFVDEQYVEELHQEILDGMLISKTTLNDIKAVYEQDLGHISNYISKVTSEIENLKSIKTQLKYIFEEKIDDARLENDLTALCELIASAESLNSELKAKQEAISAQLSKQEEDCEAFFEKWDLLIAEYNVIHATKITSIETYNYVIDAYFELIEKIDDLISEVNQYMLDESFIAIDEFDYLLSTLSQGALIIEFNSMFDSDDYVNNINLELSNKLSAVKAELERINAKYATDSSNLRAYYEEVRACISKLDALLVEAGEYDDAFIYDTCIENLIGEINLVYDDGEELSDKIKNLMADSEITRLIALSNSFDADIEAMQNHKDNGLNYKGNIERCDDIVNKMNAAIQEIDDNMEILDHDQRLVSARAKLVNGIESINASKQAIQKEHTTMLVLVIVCPILLVIVVFLLLYFFGFKKRFLRREASK